MMYRHERLTAFLHQYGFTFATWLGMARNYDPRHWMLYNEFCALEGDNQ